MEPLWVPTVSINDGAVHPSCWVQEAHATPRGQDCVPTQPVPEEARQQPSARCSDLHPSVSSEDTDIITEEETGTAPQTPEQPEAQLSEVSGQDSVTASASPATPVPLPPLSVHARLLASDGHDDAPPDMAGQAEAGPSRAQPPHHFRSGAVYTGQWRGRSRHGFGTQRWPDGTCYKGEWADGAATGRGRIIFANGDIYTGEWLSNMFHGHGVYRGRDGATYMGRWADDQREGGGLEISGGEQRGAKYAGFFLAGQKAGHGICDWPDGGQYCGEWRNDEICGSGVHRNARGGMFRGEWLNSQRHGLGCQTWPDGRSYCGRFQANREFDFGCWILPCGNFKIGYWQDGEFLPLTFYGPLELAPLHELEQLHEGEKPERPRRVSWGNVIPIVLDA